MNTTNEVLDRIKSEHGINSDYATAKLLGVSRQSLSKYRNNRNQFSDDVAFRAAELAKMNPYRVIASLHRERELDQADSRAWFDMEKKSELLNRLKNQEVIEAIKAASTGKTTASQRKILSEISEQCILCKIENIDDSFTFSAIN